ATVTDVAVDEEGSLYCVGLLDERDTEASVWSVGSDMAFRGVKGSLAGLPHKSARLFVVPRAGRVAVWSSERNVIALLDASNGETVSTYPAPSGAASVHV